MTATHFLYLLWTNNPGAATGILILGTIAALALAFNERKPTPTPPPFVPRKHVHMLDQDRSHIIITDEGGCYGTCSLAGCEEPVYIGREVYRQWNREEAGKLWEAIR